jgi:thioredoxin 2
MAPTVTPVVSCPKCRAKNRVPADARGWPRCAKCKADLPWLTHATTSDFDDVVGSAPGLVLVDAWAEWCGPCRMIAPILEDLSRSYTHQLKIVKVDVDANPEVAQRLGVQGIPALFFFRNGEIVDRVVGAQPAHAFQSKIDQLLTAA